MNEHTFEGLPDEQLAVLKDTALGDLTLAYKYEHNAHLVPLIQQSIARITAEQERRKIEYFMQRVAKADGDRFRYASTLGRMYSLATDREDGTPCTPDEALKGVSRLRDVERAARDYVVAFDGGDTEVTAICLANLRRTLSIFYAARQ